MALQVFAPGWENLLLVCMLPGSHVTYENTFNSSNKKFNVSGT